MTVVNTSHPYPLFTACYIEYLYSLYGEPCSLAPSLPKSTTYSYISQILTSDEAFKITGHLERGTIWVAMVKFHYRNVCVDSPASRNLRKIADQARQHGKCRFLSPQYYPATTKAGHRKRTALFSLPVPKCNPFIPTSTAQRKKENNVQRKMQMKRPPQKLGPISTPRVECQCAVPFRDSESAPCRCSRLNATSTSNHSSPITP